MLILLFGTPLCGVYLLLSLMLAQKQFIDDLKRALIGHHPKQLTEGAAVTCVKLCKASTYINITDCTNVLFVLVQSCVTDLKVSAVCITQSRRPSRCVQSMSRDLKEVVAFVTHVHTGPQNS